MNGAWLGPVSAHIASACRLIIFATGLHWLLACDGPRTSVAAVALAITFLPARIVRDALLRNVTVLVVALLLAAHILLGMEVELYETSMLYDKWMHALGSGAVAGLLIVATLRYCDRHCLKLPHTLFVMLVLSGALSVGTLWEMFEFAVDRTGWFSAQRGLHDTMLDLVADAIGALIVTAGFAALVSYREARQPSERVKL